MAEARAKIKSVQEKHLDRLLARPNVTAVDINYKRRGGEKTDQLCLVIWVRIKRPESGIPAEEVLPREIDGVPVDVFEGEATLGKGFQWPNIAVKTGDNTAELSVDKSAEEGVLKVRPLGTLRGGDSLGYATSKEAGTLGYFVTKRNAVGVLSNCHVMGAEGNRLLSPAEKDGGTNDHYIGTVKHTSLTTAVDCGYAPLRGRVTEFKLKDGTSVTGIEAAKVGTLIKFYGRTSGLVGTGVVQSVDWAGIVSGKRFENQILISEPARPGDSGSLLVNRENMRAIGLIFADSGQHGLANQIHDVLAALGVEIAIQ
ncbi:uncharacterized protein [Acropora muricata]|uniref:uncharacterized protein n=1 Tax=Acropora muricata TaxID=159855 RepID=UPI0034E37FA4